MFAVGEGLVHVPHLAVGDTAVRGGPGVEGLDQAPHEVREALGLLRQDLLLSPLGMGRHRLCPDDPRRIARRLHQHPTAALVGEAALHLVEGLAGEQASLELRGDTPDGALSPPGHARLVAAEQRVLCGDSGPDGEGTDRSSGLALEVPEHVDGVLHAQRPGPRTVGGEQLAEGLPLAPE